MFLAVDVLYLWALSHSKEHGLWSQNSSWLQILNPAFDADVALSKQADSAKPQYWHLLYTVEIRHKWGHVWRHQAPAQNGRVVNGNDSLPPQLWLEWGAPQSWCSSVATFSGPVRSLSGFPFWFSYWESREWLPFRTNLLVFGRCSVDERMNE